MNIEEQLQIKKDALLVLTSLNTILEAELTRHVGEFKHDNKRLYNQLNQFTEQFIYYAEKELEDEVKQAVEQFSGYFHELIEDLNNSTYNKHNLSFTTALCMTIGDVYYNYLSKDNFRHKILFEQIANVGRLFAKNNINSYNSLKYCEFFKEFTFTLIERKEYTFERNNLK